MAQQSLGALYIQDNWKVTRRLTLDIGLAMGLHVRKASEIHHRSSQFGPNVVNPNAGRDFWVA